MVEHHAKQGYIRLSQGDTYYQELRPKTISICYATTESRLPCVLNFNFNDAVEKEAHCAWALTILRSPNLRSATYAASSRSLASCSRSTT